MSSYSAKNIRARMTRRVFLALSANGAAALAAAALTGCSTSELRRNDNQDKTALASPFSPEDRLLVASVQDHLLPSEPGVPGARDIGALEYLERVLMSEDSQPDDLPLLRRGASQLQQLARSLKATQFELLSSDERESILRDFEKTDTGDSWLTLVMGFVIEAYVGDPVYGGNPGGVVWAWLGHQPGSPRLLKAEGNWQQ